MHLRRSATMKLNNHAMGQNSYGKCALYRRTVSRRKISNADLLWLCGDFTSRSTGQSSGTAKRRLYGKAIDRLVQRARTKITPECISSTAWMQAFMIGAINLHDSPEACELLDQATSSGP